MKGRTDTDILFSSVKSIRGYLCVQIFCHVLSDFLFVRCMQRESHSHGAYQDYIREVGASELIVTDNSCTQTGKKWEKTSREVMTKQRRFTPHNQNESKVEQRIGDVKHKVVLVLQRAKAPPLDILVLRFNLCSGLPQPFGKEAIGMENFHRGAEWGYG